MPSLLVLQLFYFDVIHSFSCSSYRHKYRDKDSQQFQVIGLFVCKTICWEPVVRIELFILAFLLHEFENRAVFFLEKEKQQHPTYLRTENTYTTAWNFARLHMCLCAACIFKQTTPICVFRSFRATICACIGILRWGLYVWMYVINECFLQSFRFLFCLDGLLVCCRVGCIAYVHSSLDSSI